MDKDLKEIKEYLFSTELVSYEKLFNFTNSASELLENEYASYRPKASTDFPGSLLDFRPGFTVQMPVIVVPDLHARPDFLFNILNYHLNPDFMGGREYDCTVFQALKKQLVKIVCVGDALHTERNTKARWESAQIECFNHIYTGPALSSEMLEGLNLICALMRLKELFPRNFFFLKGNHENILNRTGEGDFAFRKFADEGNMVRDFITSYYGEDILYLMSAVENALPLLAVTENCVISHGEPLEAYTREQIINAREQTEVIEGLTWTDNGYARDGSVLETIKNLTEKEDVSDCVYLAGHRPVSGNYSLRQNGQFIQIHNPGLQNIAIVRNNIKFNPETDIFGVDL